MSNNVATIPNRREVATSGPVLQPQTFDQLLKFSEMAAQSDLMPRDYKGKPANIFLAIQMGSEVGLSPMQAIQGIAVINGRPAIWGDAMMGLVRQSPLCENISETIEGDGDTRTAMCIVKRRGADAVTSRFSVGDAKKAGLWNKQGPWQQYPDRMLQQRARGFALRDSFADVLKGLKTVEEVRDYDDRPQPRQQLHAVSRPEPETIDATLSGDSLPSLDAPRPPSVPTPRTALEKFGDRIAALPDRASCFAFLDDPTIKAAFDKRPGREQEAIRDMLAAKVDAFLAGPQGPQPDDMDDAGEPDDAADAA